MHVNRYVKITVATTGAVLVAAAIFLFLRHYALHDPLEGHALPCLFKYFTGWDCPGCGSQRALHAVLNGRFSQAWEANPFVFFAAPAVVFYIIVEARRRHAPHLHAIASHPFIITAILIATITFTIARNL